MNLVRAGTRPEISLLLSCSRPRIDSEHTDRIKDLFQNNIDWNYLLNLAERHGLIPLLFHHLNSICPEAVPGPILSRLKNHFNATLGYNRFLMGELLNLLNLFENHGILAVPFKGPILAYSVYGDLSLRQFADLDILIAEKHVLKAKELLLSQKYLPIFKLSPVQERAYIQSGYEYNFEHERTRVRLEIHWKCFPGGLSFSLTLKEIGKRLKRVHIFDQEVLTLSPEDLLLSLCVHGYKHCWEALGLVCDVANLIQIHQEMDWDLLAEEAHRFGSDRILFTGLYLAKHFLDVNLPDSLWQKVLSDTKVKLLVCKVAGRLFDDRDESPGIFEISLFHIKSMTLWRDMVRYSFYLLIPPALIDHKILELPPSFSFLYFLIRPLRLLGKYTVGRLINSPPASEVSAAKENRE
jgi:hypothetical protein